MENRHDGGQAFPAVNGAKMQAALQRMVLSRSEDEIKAAADDLSASAVFGMSLRDYFAAQALSGLVANETFTAFLRGLHWSLDSTERRNDAGDADVAATSYALADAMIAERAK